jgi:hypothetical protein
LGCDKARKDRYDIDPALGKAVAQAGQKCGKASLGRAIDIIRRPATLACDRTDPNEYTVAALLECI